MEFLNGFFIGAFVGIGVLGFLVIWDDRSARK